MIEDYFGKQSPVKDTMKKIIFTYTYKVMFTYTYPFFSDKDAYGTCPYGSKTTDVFENSYNVVFK